MLRVSPYHWPAKLQMLTATQGATPGGAAFFHVAAVAAIAARVEQFLLALRTKMSARCRVHNLFALNAPSYEIGSAPQLYIGPSAAGAFSASVGAPAALEGGTIGLGGGGVGGFG